MSRREPLLDELRGGKVRPDVIKDVRVYCWGLIVRYRGTEAELLEAGLVPEHLFRTMPKCGAKAGFDEFGNRCHLQRKRNGYVLEKHYRVEAQENFGRAGSPRAVDLGPVLERFGIHLPAKGGGA